MKMLPEFEHGSLTHLSVENAFLEFILLLTQPRTSAGRLVWKDNHLKKAGIIISEHSPDLPNYRIDRRGASANANTRYPCI